MAVATTSHPAPDVLAAFGRGALPAAERAALESHVAACDTCCAALAAQSTDRLVELAREAATQPAPAEPEPSAELPAELVDHPRYRILEQIGAGGMGVVYKAEHKLMGRVVALKVIGRRYTASPVAVERFVREFKATGQLAHPNIVTAHDAEASNGLHFLVMEYVEGVSLDRLVRRRGPLPVATACQCIRQAALGLQHAFEQGMVHRDIKPHNLMVTRKGQVKVLDFGLARLAAAVESDALIAGDGTPNPSTGVTTPSLVIGTPDYLAPEQARNAHTVDIRADIYALGCVLYYLLTGRPPFAAVGSPMEKLFAHVETEPASVRQTRPEVPAEVEAVMNQMMAKSPADRFATPGEVATALKPFTRADVVVDDRPDVVEPPPLPAGAVSTAGIRAAKTMAATPRPARRRLAKKNRPARRVWPFVAAGALAAVVIGSIAAYSAYQGKGTTSNPTTGADPAAVGGPVAGKRVLFVVPHDGLHVKDYTPVAQRLKEAGVEVVTASTATSECWAFKGAGRTGVTPSKLVAEVNPADFAAVLFCGAIMTEYTRLRGEPGIGHEAVERILKEMRAARKVVGAICEGQRVLLEFQVIRGKVFGVVTSDRVVTAEKPEEATQFADAVLAALAK